MTKAFRGGTVSDVRLPRREELDANALDIAVAAGLTVISQLSIWLGNTDEGPKAITVPVALIATIGLVWRRKQPMLMAGLLMAGWLLQAAAARSPSATWELVVLLL